MKKTANLVWKYERKTGLLIRDGPASVSDPLFSLFLEYREIRKAWVRGSHEIDTPNVLSTSTLVAV